MRRVRKQYSPEFKLKAVIEILKGDKTAAQLVGELEVHPLVLCESKRHFWGSEAQIFERPRKASKTHEETKEKAELFEQIGRLKMEIEWLKRKLGVLTEMKGDPSLKQRMLVSLNGGNVSFLEFAVLDFTMNREVQARGSGAYASNR